MIDLIWPGTEILILQVPVDSLLPVGIMIVCFMFFGIFFQLANVLTSRVYIDAIPNRVRNGVYSLFPTLVFLMGIPQIAFFGWLISVSLPMTLVSIGIISTAGCLLIRKGLQHPHPKELEKGTEEPAVDDFGLFTDEYDELDF
jgi:hypothetical protein